MEHPFLTGLVGGLLFGWNEASMRRMMASGVRPPWWRRHVLLLTLWFLPVLGLVMLTIGQPVLAYRMVFSIQMLIALVVTFVGYRRQERRFRYGNVLPPLSPVWGSMSVERPAVTGHAKRVHSPGKDEEHRP